MTKEQRDHLEQRLLRERQRVVKALQKLDEKLSAEEQDGDLTTYPFHLADEGTDTMEQEQGLLLRSKEGVLLYGIDDALRMLYKEPARFGKCAICESDIAVERLDIVPWAKLCLECQRIQEDTTEAA